MLSSSRRPLLSHVVRASALFLGLGRTAGAQLHDEAVCHQASTRPEPYLVDTAELPIQVFASPTPTGMPSAAVSGLGIFEVVCFLVLGLAACCGLAWMLRQSRSLGGLTRAGLAAAGVCGLGGVLCLASAIDNGLRIRAVDQLLTDAKVAHDDSRWLDADTQLQRVEDRQFRSLVWRGIPYYRPALERLDVASLRTANGLSAAEQAIGAKDEEMASRALEGLGERSETAARARAALHTHLADWRLANDATGEAVTHLVQADAQLGASEVERSNLCHGRYHHVVRLVSDGQIDEAVRLRPKLEPPECELVARHRVAAQGLVARGHLDVSLDEEGDIDTAVEMLEASYRAGREHGFDWPFLVCDLSAGLDARAVGLLASDRPAEAVETLDRAEEIFPGRAFVAATLPRALYALGGYEITREDFPAAIRAMQRGYDLTRGDPMLAGGLSLAHRSFGTHKLEAGDLDGGIVSFEHAFTVTPNARDTQHSLANALLARSEGAMKKSSSGEALRDLERVGVISPDHRASARVRAAVVEGTDRRLATLTSKPGWLAIPGFEAEVPKDADLDGRLDHVLYYGSDRARPIAIGHLDPGRTEPSALILFDEEKVTTAIIRDHDDDGQLDERMAYSGEHIDMSIVDADRDLSPDVRVEFREGLEFSRQFLSGQIRMVMRDGVVNGGIDVFSQADVYVKLFQNHHHAFTSDTIKNSNFPIWHRGTVVHYRYGDSIRLELWDRDTWTRDDLIGTYRTSQLPESGVYRFKDGQKETGAVRVDVSPTDLAPGHVFRSRAPTMTSNYFRDHPAATEEYGDLVRQAEADAMRAQVMGYMARRTVYTAINASSMNPIQRSAARLIAGIVLENTM